MTCNPMLFACLVAGCILAAAVAAADGPAVTRRVLPRETDLGKPGAPAAVILVPDAREYRALGRELARRVEARCGVRLEVQSAAGLVAEHPRRVKPEALDRHFILLGQFWNNAVLERLYAGFYDPTDAVFPGPGGFELRTICSPFRAGHNCIVATGSDLAGCRRAVGELVARLGADGERALFPFLHQVALTGDAAEVEAAYRKQMAPALAEIERYAVLEHPQAKTWTGEDPRDYLTRKDRNLAAAALFGLRYWASGGRRDADAFKRLVLGCCPYIERLAQDYREGRVDLMDYTGPELTLAWDRIAETDAFTEAEREQITDFIYRLIHLNRDAYYVHKCKDAALPAIPFSNRHPIAGTFWMGLAADWLTRKCVLSDEQRALADAWRAHSDRYLERLMQAPFYSDGVQLIHDEGGLVLREALMRGRTELFENGSLRQLADYWAACHDSLGEMASSGHNGSTRKRGAAGEVLNAAGWAFPGEGYQWARRRLGRWPYEPFLFYPSMWWGGASFPFFNYELPGEDDGSRKLARRMGGVSVLPIGEAFADWLRRHPETAGGGYQRIAGRYQDDLPPYGECWKRIALRTGFEAGDQYLALDGMQGLEWSYEDLNAIVRYTDLGQPLLKSQWDARNVESRLELNTLFASNGVPGAKQSVAARLLGAADLGPLALLHSRAGRHDGVAWTRHLFWRKNGWFLVADEVRPHQDGDHFLAQTWLSWHPFTLSGAEATAKTKDVTLHVVGTPERSFAPALGSGGPEGVRQQVSARLEKERPFTLWTLVYASGRGRQTQWSLRQVAANAVLLSPEGGDGSTEAWLAFTGALDLGPLHVSADMGLVSPTRLSAVGCREIALAGRPLLSAPEGSAFGWDLHANRFDAGKAGFGLQAGQVLPELRRRRARVAAALRSGLDAAAGQALYVPPQVGAAGGPPPPELPVVARLELAPPVSLAAADLDGDGTDELLAYNADGSPRFPGASFVGDPVAVDFDGQGRPDIALSLQKAVAVYRPDGSLRWRQELTNTAAALSAGDLDGDGRQELGLSQQNYAMVLDAAGKPLVDEEVYRYNGIGGAFGDVDGDGRVEFVAATVSGLNVLKPGKPRKTAGFQSYFGQSPCRLWLRDLDGDGVPECYLGGSGTDPACYDLRAMQCRWSFRDAPIHPKDAALLDVDGDGKLEMVSGGGDGFLYVVSAVDGAFRFSRSVGAAVTALAALPDGALAVGLETGRVLLLGRGLEPIGRAELGEPVAHLAALRRAGRPAEIIAAGKGGTAQVMGVR